MQSQTQASTLNLRKPRNKAEEEKFRMNAELENAKAELQRVKAEAAAAQQATERRIKKSRRDAKVRLRVTAVVMLTAALIKIIWLSAHTPQAPILPTVPLPATAGGITAAYAATNSPGNYEFTRSLNRLRDAFHSFPDDDQLDIVREINRRHPGAAMACPLAWNAAGVPSLYVGDEEGQVPPSVITALNQCASEVEKLRVEKGLVR
jgi:hypothetical protein